MRLADRDYFSQQLQSTRTSILVESSSVLFQVFFIRKRALHPCGLGNFNWPENREGLPCYPSLYDA